MKEENVENEPELDSDPEDFKSGDLGRDEEELIGDVEKETIEDEENVENIQYIELPEDPYEDLSTDDEYEYDFTCGLKGCNYKGEDMADVVLHIRMKHGHLSGDWELHKCLWVLIVEAIGNRMDRVMNNSI